MTSTRKDKSNKARRSDLVHRQKRRNKLETDHRGDDRSYSLEGLRLGQLLSQLQALQAVQGLQQIKPRGKHEKGKYEFSTNPAEQSSHRQWLMFKADWLEALLEDTLDELEALDAFDADAKANQDDPGKEDAGPSVGDS